MKINGGGSIKPVAPASTPEITAGKAVGGTTPTPAPARDRVEITAVSAQLAQLEKVLSDLNIVDTVRVEAIKQAIAEGRFRIDSDVVADRLLATVREFLARQKA